MKASEFSKTYNIAIGRVYRAIRQEKLTSPGTYNGKIVIDEKAEEFIEKQHKKAKRQKYRTIHLKRGDAWAYRDDAMGNGCRP